MNRKSAFWKTWITVVVIVLLSALVLTACSSETPASEEVARPSNGGGPGEAINLTGDASAGANIFTQNCVACHGDQGKGGIPNPGSDDGTVPGQQRLQNLRYQPGSIHRTRLDARRGRPGSGDEGLWR